MIRAPNSLNLNFKVRVKKEAPGPSVSEDIFCNYNIDTHMVQGTMEHIQIRCFPERKLLCFHSNWSEDRS